MKVFVNGESQEAMQGQSLASTLELWGYSLDLPMAIAVNQEVIYKTAFNDYFLQEADQIEILMPMQGG